jgi:catechol 2,3-dioxygenase-like lactoylglutathione lyase family enzyme
MLAFYTDVLGLVEERRIDAIGLVQLRAGRSMVDLVPAAAGVAETGSLDHFCLDVDAESVGAVSAHLEAHGATPLGPPMETYGAHGVGSSVYVRDPEGNVVELKVGPRVE